MKIHNIAFSNYFIIGMIFILAGCKSNTTVDKNIAEEVLFQVILTDSHGNSSKRENKLISSSEKLATIFNTINSTRMPAIPIPEIDFSKETVAFISAGQLSTGGFSVAVDKIEKTSTEVIVYIGGQSPRPGENVTMALTSPCTMVKFKKQNLPITFKQTNQ